MRSDLSEPGLTARQLDAVLHAASPELLRRALRLVIGSDLAYWERDLEKQSIWYSPKFFSMLGLPPEAQDREQVNSTIHPDDRARFEQAYEEALRSGGRFSVDLRYLDYRRMYRWARTSARVWLNAEGRATFVTGVVADIDADKKAIIQAQEDRRIYEEGMHLSSEARFTASASISDLRLDSNFARLLGYRSEETSVLDAKRWMHLTHQEDRAALSELLREAMQTTGHRACRLRLLAEDGSYRWYDVRCESYRDSFGLVRLVGVLSDCHQLAKLQEEVKLMRAALEQAKPQRA